MSEGFESTFRKLRSIVQKHASKLAVKEDSATCYSLEGTVGPATLRAWGGKLKRRTIPVGWVQIGKAYVSYHLMGLAGNGKLVEGMSKELQARMQGKTCFNFNSVDERLFNELDALTAQAFAAFERAGYVGQGCPRSRDKAVRAPETRLSALPRQGCPRSRDKAVRAPEIL